MKELLRKLKLGGGNRGSFVRKHPGLILYLMITLLIVTLYANDLSLFEGLGASIQDTLFKVRKQEHASGEVVILAIDNQSVAQLGNWPWSHQRLAQLVEALSYYSPRAVLIQPRIEESVEDYVAGNSQLLSENILQSNNVVLTFEPSIASRTPKSSTAPDWLRSSALTSIFPYESEDIPRVNKIELPEDFLGRSAFRIGAEFRNFDSDDKIRYQPMLFRYERYTYASAELLLAATALNVPLDKIAFNQDEQTIALGNISVPVDSEGRYLINLYGPPMTFPKVSIKDFWEGRTQVKHLKDKIVIIGITALGLSDQMSTSLGEEYTPAEITASVVDNMISGKVISPLRSSQSFELLAIVIIGLICSVMLPRIQLLYRYVVLFILMVVVANVGYILFTSFNTLSNILYPTLELALFVLAAPLLSRELQKKEKAVETDPAQVSTDRDLKPVTEEADDKTSLFDELKPNETVQKDARTVAFDDASDKTRVDSQVDAPPPPRKEPSAPTSTVKDDSDGARKHFGRYEVMEVLGKGAMGTVYKGKDPAIGRLVALKTIRLDKIADASEIGELRERLQREAKAAGGLSHPNIVTIYDVGEDGDTQYIAMEYLEGYTLEGVIGRGVDMNLKLAGQIGYQICSALSYAHRNNIVHRDIKPANVMVLENFHVKVMDFGIAHFESSSLTQTGIAMGTPSYISPEQLKGEQVTPSSDIFSLGVVIYEILTGQKPFIGNSISNLIMKIINEDPPLPSLSNDKIPPVLDPIVTKALKKDPLERYGSADEMGRALRDFISAFAPSASKSL